MNAHRALNSFGSVKVVGGVATANNVELIMMLFDGLIESLSLARGHIQHGSIELKSRALQRAASPAVEGAAGATPGSRRQLGRQATTGVLAAPSPSTRNLLAPLGGAGGSGRHLVQ